MPPRKRSKVAGLFAHPLIQVNVAHPEAYLLRDGMLRGSSYRKELSMLDLMMLALGLGFFALSIGYAYACDRL
jgi:hypothetical protein